MAEPISVTAASLIATFASDIAAKQLEPGLMEKTCSRVLDFIGNVLAASGEAAVMAVMDFAAEQSPDGPSTVVHSGRRTRPALAALVNGTAAHCLDFDDTHLPSVVHPSSPVVAAALAVAEQTGASGRRFIEAVAVGVETVCRLGMAAYEVSRQNSLFLEHGQHPTSICGTVGAAVSAGMLRGFDPASLTSVIGVATSFSSGILEATRSGGSVKQVHAGWAAHAGVVAAELVAHGLTGPPTSLDGDYGLLRALVGDEARLESIARDLGVHWASDNTAIRAYPCNHFTHPGIDAALALREAGVRPIDVQSAVLGLPRQAIAMLAEPAEAKSQPSDSRIAAFSGPYTVAAALAGGGGLGVGREDFEESAIFDPVRRDLARKIRCIVDGPSTDAFPEKLLAILTVELKSGEVIERRITETRGGPERPLTLEEQVRKFESSAEGVLEAASASAITKMVFNLGAQRDVSGLLFLLRGAWD